MDIRTKQRAVVEALEEVKGRDIVVFNTERLPSMFERVVIASADSNRQVKALADRVTTKIKSLGAKVLGVEGDSSAEWVLVDLGEIVVHVMHHTVRAHYNLEELWGGKTVKFAPPVTADIPDAKKVAVEKPARKRKASAKAVGKTSAKPAPLELTGSVPARAKPARNQPARNPPAGKPPTRKPPARKAPAAKATVRAKPAKKPALKTAPPGRKPAKARQPARKARA